MCVFSWNELILGLTKSAFLNWATVLGLNLCDPLSSILSPLFCEVHSWTSSPHCISRHLCIRVSWDHKKRMNLQSLQNFCIFEVFLGHSWTSSPSCFSRHLCRRVSWDCKWRTFRLSDTFCIFEDFLNSSNLTVFQQVYYLNPGSQASSQNQQAWYYTLFKIF